MAYLGFVTSDSTCANSEAGTAYFLLFCLEFMFYLCYLYLFTYIDVKHDFHIRWCSCRLTVTRRVFRSLVFYNVFCRSLFVLLSFLPFLDLRPLITPLVSSHTFCPQTETYRILFSITIWYYSESRTPRGISTIINFPRSIGRYMGSINICRHRPLAIIY
jgi:hypothetical protein